MLMSCFSLNEKLIKMIGYTPTELIEKTMMKGLPSIYTRRSFVKVITSTLMNFTKHQNNPETFEEPFSFDALIEVKDDNPKPARCIQTDSLSANSILSVVRLECQKCNYR
eukprot:TRINITY_DN18051_c0_g1_i1.p1 TRINITY_DN18051_c0_g1~~TRINITY_DN18051_c0_g1_i1.p1  ORF type:complete len:110 (+),score=5.26 TRINITY_DN18051_c0_g1_i1:102-431(+)